MVKPLRLCMETWRIAETPLLLHGPPATGGRQQGPGPVRGVRGHNNIAHNFLILQKQSFLKLPLSLHMYPYTPFEFRGVGLFHKGDS